MVTKEGSGDAPSQRPRCQCTIHPQRQACHFLAMGFVAQFLCFSVGKMSPSWCGIVPGPQLTGPVVLEKHHVDVPIYQSINAAPGWTGDIRVIRLGRGRRLSSLEVPHTPYPSLGWVPGLFPLMGSRNQQKCGLPYSPTATDGPWSGSQPALGVPGVWLRIRSPPVGLSFSRFLQGPIPTLAVRLFTHSTQHPGSGAWTPRAACGACCTPHPARSSQGL